MKSQSFVQIKIHKTLFDDHNEITIQIIDISLNIMNKQIKYEIDLENQIRGWCCHELRNPLNSIINSAELLESYFDEKVDKKN
jgi:signal transduction histidine kinase